MARVPGPAGAAEPRVYAAIAVRDVGWALTRRQAEAAADALKKQPDRFLLPVDEGSPQGATRPTLSIPPGYSIWDYGEPARVDLVDILRRLADAATSTDRETATLALGSVVDAAIWRFGDADPRAIEARFDPLVATLGGERRDDPPAYVIPIASVLVGVPPPPGDEPESPAVEPVNG